MKDKEFILAQFVLQPDDFRLFLRLRAYEKQGNLIIINHDQSSQVLNGIVYPIVDVKIEPSFATLLKLKDGELAERMRISYISDELKNKNCIPRYLKSLGIANFIPVELDTTKSVLCSTVTYSRLYKDGRVSASRMMIFYADDELPSFLKLKYKEEIKLVEITDEIANTIRDERYVYFSNKNSTLFKKLREVQILSNRRTTQ